MSVTERGQHGAYGGRYVPETLVPALEELERGWDDVRDDESFRSELAPAADVRRPPRHPSTAPSACGRESGCT